MEGIQDPYDSSLKRDRTLQVRYQALFNIRGKEVQKTLDSVLHELQDRNVALHRDLQINRRGSGYLQIGETVVNHSYVNGRSFLMALEKMRRSLHVVLTCYRGNR